MVEHKVSPSLIFRSSWEVCNKVGGIYTVLSTQAASMQKLYKDKVIYLGPDLSGKSNQPGFVESPRLFSSWKKQAEKEGLKVRAGRWQVPGKPIAVLVDFSSYYSRKDIIYRDFWEWFGVDSLNSYGDYDEACMFAYACGEVIKSFVSFSGTEPLEVVAHFDEWLSAMGLLYCEHYLPKAATVFTTHSTTVGRSIAVNNKPLYDYLNLYDGDRMAGDLNVFSKHSVEKAAAFNADQFTTVSDVTANECMYLLGKAPDIVTHNGFTISAAQKGRSCDDYKKETRKLLFDVAEALFGYKLKPDTMFVGLGGRYEFRNKGIDVFIDSLAKLRKSDSLKKDIVAYIMVPGDVSAPREEVINRLSKEGKFEKGAIYFPYITHWMHNIEGDRTLNMIKYKGFENIEEDRVKIIFVPCYLDGNDGIFNRTYYDILKSLDLTAFPSYYEPWGYTPVESLAFSVPTVTTDLSGFGRWISRDIKNPNNIKNGIAVLKRTDNNYFEVVSALADIIGGFTMLTEKERKAISGKSKKLAGKVLWSEFIEEEQKVYEAALNKVRK